MFFNLNAAATNPAARAQVVGFHSPDVVASGAPRPCIFVKLANGNYYAISKSTTNYAELRQLALTAYVLKVTVDIYLTGNTCGNAPEIDAITLL